MLDGRKYWDSEDNQCPVPYCWRSPRENLAEERDRAGEKQAKKCTAQRQAIELRARRIQRASPLPAKRSKCYRFLAKRQIQREQQRFVGLFHRLRHLFTSSGKRKFQWATGLAISVVGIGMAIGGGGAEATESRRVGQEGIKNSRNQSQVGLRQQALQSYWSSMTVLMTEQDLLNAPDNHPDALAATSLTREVLQQLSISDEREDADTEGHCLAEDSILRSDTDRNPICIDEKRAVIDRLVSPGLLQPPNVDLFTSNQREWLEHSDNDFGYGLPTISLRESDLRLTDLSGADLSGADLSGADLSSANLNSADLGGANFNKAYLSGTYLNSADLSRANLRSADLYDADLGSADLSDANLIGADLSGANLNSANLSRAHFSGADLSGTNLSGADFSGAYLSGAIFNGTDLSGTDFSGANLNGTDLSGANLSGANLAEIFYTSSTNWPTNFDPPPSRNGYDYNP